MMDIKAIHESWKFCQDFLKNVKILKTADNVKDEIKDLVQQIHSDLKIYVGENCSVNSQKSDDKWEDYLDITSDSDSNGEPIATSFRKRKQNCKKVKAH